MRIGPNIYKRRDGRWEARVVIGKKAKLHFILAASVVAVPLGIDATLGREVSFNKGFRLGRQTPVRDAHRRALSKKQHTGDQCGQHHRTMFHLQIFQVHSFQFK